MFVWRFSPAASSRPFSFVIELSDVDFSTIAWMTCCRRFVRPISPSGSS